MRREWPTDIGPVDLMCRDDEDGWVAVEIKRVGTIDAVEQLSRYLERIRLDPALADCAGVLAAQIVKPQARVLAEARGLRWVEVDLAELRGEREPALTLFGVVSEAVLAEARDGVLEITLNRPEARNAVNAAVAEGVAAALDRLDGDDALRVGDPHGRRRLVLRRHGPEGVRGRRAARTRRAAASRASPSARPRSRSSRRSRATPWPAGSRSRSRAT